ncbi:ABC transporter ATP-binding protein [Nostoc sp. NIES-2111]
MDKVIIVDGIGKYFRIGAATNSRPTLKDAIGSLLSGNLKEKTSGFWALRDVNLEIRRGEIVGLIGANGAGKSTLLKVLSRITEPTTGTAHVKGRVSSLLEVGTGFHDELTGRENIYLNGAILGMSRQEIDSRLDAIVSFSGVGKFLDTQVKHYSSGMYMRLAFSVAAHVYPDILFVDEVLSVGDAEFQSQCLERIHQLASEERTIFFVTHNLGIVQALCTRAVRLEAGRVVDDGEPGAVISAYMNKVREPEECGATAGRRGSGPIWFEKVEVVGAQAAGIAAGSPVTIRFHLGGHHPSATCSFAIWDAGGQPITSFDSAIRGKDDSRAKAGMCFDCEIAALPLLPGKYRLDAGLAADGSVLDHLEVAAMLNVLPGQFAGRPVIPVAGYGSVVVPHRWVSPPPG